MAKTTRPLTNTEVKQAKAKEKEYNLSDGQGLALRVKPNGTKQWLFNYQRPITKKRVNISFGVFPDLSMAQARELRKEARSLLAQGIDPQEHKKATVKQEEQNRRNTFRFVAEKWMEVKQTEVGPKTKHTIWSSLENHIFPVLGDVPIHQLNAPDTIQVLKPIAAKGTLETVKRLINRINQVMDFATNTGILEHNPLAKITKAFPTHKAINRPTIKPEELPTLMSKIQNANIKRATRCLIEWQLHTMVRPVEAAHTRWDEIDFENALWIIPKERIKMKDRDHTIPLSNPMLSLLNSMKTISSHREYVFPGNNSPKKPANPETVNRALKRMGYGGKLVSHGFRALASTTLNEQGFDKDIVEAALAHKDCNEIRAAYNRAEYIERRRNMMEHWSQQIENAKMIGSTYAVTSEAIKLDSVIDGSYLDNITSNENTEQ